MGTLGEIVNHARPEAPALLFEDVPGYPKGMRLISGATNSSKRLAITMGLPVPDCPLDVVRAYRDRMQSASADPAARPSAPGRCSRTSIATRRSTSTNSRCRSCTRRTAAVIIGTDDLVIMRDPDGGLDQLRAPIACMVHDKNHVTSGCRPASTAGRSAKSISCAGKPCPVLISCGHDPLLFLAGGNELSFGLSEFDYAGGHRGMPYEVVPSELHGLPMPAHAEIVLEGEMVEATRRAKARSANSPATTRRRRPSSRWCMCSASITATIRSSRSPRRCSRRRISRSANA